MSWQDTLTDLLSLLNPLRAAIADEPGLTIEDAWAHPRIAPLRDRLVAGLARPPRIEQLLLASQELVQQHRSLLAQPDLSPEQLGQLGVLSALAYVLSAESLARAVTARGLFLHALQNIFPWALRAEHLLAAGPHPRSISISSDPLSFGEEPADAQEAGQAIAQEEALLDDDHDTAALPEEDSPEPTGEGTCLYLRLVDSRFRPQPGRPFVLSGLGLTCSGSSDAAGEILFDGCSAGAYLLTVAAAVYTVHSLSQRDLAKSPEPYHIVVAHAE